MDEAHNRDRPVLAHCRCTDAINVALDAGVAVSYTHLTLPTNREV